jgi:hypothetical protein
MLHKNADLIKINLSEITIREVVIQGQRYQEILQGKTLLFQGKKSQLPAAQAALAYKVIETQAKEIKETNDKVSDLIACNEVNANSIKALEKAMKEIATLKKKKTPAKFTKKDSDQ